MSFRGSIMKRWLLAVLVFSSSSCEFLSSPDDGETGVFRPSVTCESEAPSLIDPTIFPPCAADAHCIKKELVDAVNSRARDFLGNCPTNIDDYCVPDAFVLGGSTYIPDACDSVVGVEGRCISRVVPKVAELGEFLPQSSCAPTERCAPCFDPRDESNTGACNATECDNPVAAPLILEDCGDGLGSCVPVELLPDPETQLSFVNQLDCLNNEEVCVPKRVLQEGPYTACNNTLFLVPFAGSCLNAGLLTLPNETFLSQGNCPSELDVCTPCVLFGSPTGAPGC